MDSPVPSEGPQPRYDHHDHCKSVEEYCFADDPNTKFRSQMEDDYVAIDDILQDEEQALFAIIDGHGGDEVVKYVTENLKENFLKIYEDYSEDLGRLFEILFDKLDGQLKMLECDTSGATICICYIRKEDGDPILFVANVGDCKAIISGPHEYNVVSHDHKAIDPSEKIRVREVGGKVINGKVGGIRSCSRTLGDLQLKKAGLINTPHYQRLPLKNQDKYLSLITAGVWEQYSDEEIDHLVRESYTVEKASKALVDGAIQRGSEENCSALVIKLPKI